MSDANKDLVHRWVEQIFNERQADVADDVVFGQQAPGLVDGPVHTRATVEFLRAQFPDIRMTIEAMAADEDLVSVRVVATGTNLGPLNGMLPPTGRSFRAQQSHWFRVSGGKLAEHWATRDDLSTMLQLGVIPMPGPPEGAPTSGAAS
jgi:predicted ester cyclase